MRGVLDWLGGWPERGDRPFFLWLHLFDPHTPYRPPGDWLERFAGQGGEPPPPRVEPPSIPVVENPPLALRFLDGVTNADWARYMYHSEVAYCDALLARVAGLFDQQGLGGRTAWVVTADHGESLGERGNWYNHMGLFDEVVRVPLVAYFPGREALGRSAALASTVDVAPTLLDYAGLAIGPADRGRLLHELADEGADSRRVWFEHSDNLQAGCRDGDYYFITTLSDQMRFGIEVYTDEAGRRLRRHVMVPEGTSYLFDLRADPEMRHNLAAERPALVERYLAELADWRRQARGTASGRRTMTDEERSELGNIGYFEVDSSE